MTDNTMTKEWQAIQWPKNDRQYNDQRMTGNTMTKEGQTIQWPKKDRQYNDQRMTGNTMTKEGQAIQWPKRDRQYNDQIKNDQWTNNDLENTTQKTKDWATRTPSNTGDCFISGTRRGTTTMTDVIQIVVSNIDSTYLQNPFYYLCMDIVPNVLFQY
jgi:hypothetical protein